ncbi:hypothetical protein [Klebsiella aerogenes]|uniref:hypothetical protein n=1 Tax=Klebsiella aerogenes TaxID=548 RepID=UPI00351D3009
MNNGQQIAIIKCGWSDWYEGGPVQGRHGYIQEREAHEKFNFLHHPTEGYQVYIPPMGIERKAPRPRDPDNWLLVMVAAEEGSKPLKIVGWYEGASFNHDGYRPRTFFFGPESEARLTDHGDDYYYCITARKAVCVPPEKRTEAARIDGRHLGSTPIAYIEGHGRTRQTDPWRDSLYRTVTRFIQHYTQNESAQNHGLVINDALC